MSTEVHQLFQALEVLTMQVQTLAEHSGGRRKQWDMVDRYKNIKIFDGSLKDYEEFSTKLRSQVAAGDLKVGRLMKAVENECTEDQLARGRYDECSPEFDESDADFIVASSSEMYNLLLNMTTGRRTRWYVGVKGRVGWLGRN